MDNKEKQNPYIGRATRLQYWILMILCGLPGYLIAEYSTSWFGIMFWVILAIPIIHVNIGRWHDLGNSGWMTLLTFIPIVGFIASIYL